MSEHAPSRVEIHGERSHAFGPFRIDEVDVSYEGYDGRTIGPVRRVVFERGDSAAALVVHRERRSIVLVEQFKLPAHLRAGSGWIVETVAGIVEPGETPEASIRRELVEESGYEVSALEPIATFFVSPGATSERIFLYLAEVTESDRVGAGGGVAGEGEDIRRVEVPLAELDSLLERGEIRDAKTLVALLWLQRRGSGR